MEQSENQPDLPEKNGTARMAERNRLLSVLLNVSNLSAQDADPRMLGDAVLERLHGLLFCDASLCYLVQGKRLVHIARKGPLRDFVGRHPLQHSTLPFGAAFLSRRQPHAISDLLAEGSGNEAVREQLAQFLDGPGSIARCWMFLPMVLRGRVLGVIVVAHHEPGHFDAEDRVFGAAFAHQAAIEFENARLARDARMRADEVRTMLEVQQAIARRVDLQEVIRLITQEARRLTVSAGALLFLKEEESWSLAGAIGHSTHRSLTSALQPVDLQDTLDALVKTRRPYHLRAANGSGRFGPLLRAYGIEDMLCAPIMSGGKEDERFPVGLLCVMKPLDSGFEANDLRILWLLASSAVMGVENARLYASERQLRQQEAEKAAGAERTRLARELHDAVTQTLFSASLVAEVLPRIWAKNPDKGMERLEEVRLLTRGALAEMRTLLLELRPKALEQTALDELLKQLVNAASGRARIPVAADFHGCGEVPYEVKLGMYRIAQEALNNVVKHAQATQVRVSTRGHCDAENRCLSLSLEISDDGIGFAPQDIPGGHFGVGIMRERAESFGGALDVASCAGLGTCIRVVWPAPAAAE
jgi:two-component system nitrate/nitrite sensor histidine kinase NarX